MLLSLRRNISCDLTLSLIHRDLEEQQEGQPKAGGNMPGPSAPAADDADQEANGNPHATPPVPLLNLLLQQEQE